MAFNMDDYEPVEVRIERLYAADPQARVTTDLIAYGESGYIVKASVYRTGESEPWATGYAQESVTQRGVNATSALENCETSAIGRALANAGFAAKAKRPSREEMAKAQAAQQAKPIASAEMLDVWAEQIGNATTVSDLNAIAHELARYDLGDARADLTTAYTARKAVLDAS